MDSPKGNWWASLYGDKMEKIIVDCYPKPIDLGDEEKQIKDYYNLVIKYCHLTKIEEVMRGRERELKELKERYNDKQTDM